MLRVGLTGNIGSGKSTVSAIWRELGAHVIDADVLARRAVEPGSPGLRAVVAAFGADVLRPDGSLDRDAVRRRVFADAAARRRLEAIVHPEVDRLRREAEAALAAQGIRVVVHEVPLLFEVGLDASMDVVVVVDAPEAVRIRRVVETRGLERAEAERMSAAQMPAEEKRRRADVVLENDADLATLRARAETAWRDLLARVTP